MLSNCSLVWGWVPVSSVSCSSFWHQRQHPEYACALVAPFISDLLVTAPGYPFFLPFLSRSSARSSDSTLSNNPLLHMSIHPTVLLLSLKLFYAMWWPPWRHWEFGVLKSWLTQAGPGEEGWGGIVPHKGWMSHSYRTSKIPTNIWEEK